MGKQRILNVQTGDRLRKVGEASFDFRLFDCESVEIEAFQQRPRVDEVVEGARESRFKLGHGRLQAVSLANLSIALPDLRQRSHPEGIEHCLLCCRVCAHSRD
ncbi:hypothetical protein [Mesorhizobium atlanticum]|uniref:hypothetical protein n=1 Tax=Mesorhizobium atlanticum TaxID=2233532 RepID=UPI00315D0160